MSDDDAYRSTTLGITVAVRPRYLAARSTPAEGQWVWGYAIDIENGSDGAVQLLKRAWRIVDGNGKVEHVAGAGVVGEQPILNPGDTFRYSSGCPLPTPSGFMEGHYTFVDEDGDSFEVAIPAFSLDVPNAPRALN
ncbi:Co2+/Mg2+ efflux protein ApaG [Rhizobiaceae bacterium]|nr:Co2+/Mg2+ efflux protein ApaG [Rhizobiaceae bacterium]